MKFREFLTEADTSEATEFENWITLAYNADEFNQIEDRDALLDFGVKNHGVTRGDITSEKAFETLISKWKKLKKQNSPIINSSEKIAASIKIAFFGKKKNTGFMKQTGASSASVSNFWRKFRAKNNTPKTDMFIEMPSGKKLLISLKKWPNSRLMSAFVNESEATMMAALTQYDSNIEDKLKNVITKFANKIGKLNPTELGINNSVFNDISKSIQSALKADGDNVDSKSIIRKFVSLAKEAGVKVPTNPNRKWVINNVASIKKSAVLSKFDIESKFQKDIPTIAFKINDDEFVVPRFDEIDTEGNRRPLVVSADKVKLGTTTDVIRIANEKGRTKPEVIQKAKETIEKELVNSFDNYLAEQENFKKLNDSLTKILDNEEFRINFATEAASGDIKFADGDADNPEISDSFAHASYMVEFDSGTGAVNINNITVSPLTPSPYMSKLSSEIKIFIGSKSGSGKAGIRNAILSANKTGKGELETTLNVESVIHEVLSEGGEKLLLEDCIGSMYEHNLEVLSEGIFGDLKDLAGSAVEKGKEFFSGLLEKIKVLVSSVMKKTFKKIEDIIKSIPKTFKSFFKFLKEFLGLDIVAKVEGDEIVKKPSGDTSVKII